MNSNSEEQYRVLFESNPNPMWVYDLETLTFLAVNNAAINHYGYSREEFLSMTIKDIRPPEDIPVLLDKISRISKGLDVSGIWRHKKKDGAIIDVEITSHSLAFAGRHARLVLANDITSRKQAEEALRQSEQKQRLVLDNIDEIAYMVNTTEADPFGGVVQFVSGSVKNFLGYQQDEFLADPSLWFRSIHPDDIPALIESTRNVLATRKTGTRIYRLHHKDTGEYRLMEDRVVPQLDKTGNVIGIFGVARDITERKQTEEMIQRLAYYDVLTGLPNRTLLHDRLQQAIFTAKSENKPLALLVMDLDRFKEINNTLGHQSGDIILKHIGENLQEALPDADTIARIGGDEFAVVLKNKDAEASIHTADKIIKKFEEPFYLEGLSIAVSASIGIALCPDHGEDADTLIMRANIAMHAARKAESSYTIYSYLHNPYSTGRLALMGELSHAIDSNQLFLLYQPKIDLKNGMTTGVEALVRWQHPKLGIISPDQFIELSEKTGLIRQLTFRVIREAMRQSIGWHEQGIEVSVAVNLSVRSLQAAQFLDQIKELLYTCGIASNKLRLEITESIIMADPERAMEIITDLTRIGVRFSIDDFGTGYSSLSYLKRLPVDEIKIDKSFVINMMKDENDALIVHSIIELGHNLGIKITAEGVENKATLKRLALLGCDQAQGYFISKPIPAPELTGWLSKSL